MAETSKTKVAVIGVGRMGRHHARTYNQLPLADLVGVVDLNEERAATIADEFGTRYFPNVDRLLEADPDVAAVTVAVPTVRHRQVAVPLLERGIACLVEKPLAPATADARAMVEVARKHDVTLQVGHTERFNPAVRTVLGMKLPVRFLEVVRVSPMTFRSLDVGVVMDMMIHDLDIVLTLARSPLARVDAVGVTVMGEHEDICNARLTFESGCVANITASRLAMRTERRLRLFSESAYVSLDYQKQYGIIIQKSMNTAALEDARGQIAAGADLSDIDYTQVVNVQELSMDVPTDEEDPLTAELKSFLRCVRSGERPVVDGEAGCLAVEAAQRVVTCVQNHRWEGLPDTRVSLS